jgi:hypothetical protein
MEQRSPQAVIAGKRLWRSPPPTAPEVRTGFTGWRSRGYLPHFDRQGLDQFVTFRLADALPAERHREWEPLLAIEDERERLIQIEAYLDRGHGVCHHADPSCDRSAGVEPARSLAELRQGPTPAKEEEGDRAG